MQVIGASPYVAAYGGNVGGNLSPPPPAATDSAPVQVQQPVSAPTSPTAARPHCLSPAPAASTDDPNWQASRAGLRERNAAMFNNELMADVHFICGPTGQWNGFGGGDHYSRRLSNLSLASAFLYLGTEFGGRATILYFPVPNNMCHSLFV